MNIFLISIFFLALFFGYWFVCNRLAIAVQPLREKAAFVGQTLLEDGDLTQKDAAILEYQLDNIYSAWLIWSYVIFAPAAVSYVLWRQIIGKESAQSAYSVETQQQLNYVKKMVFFSRLATSPIATLLLGIEFVVAILLFLIVIPKKTVPDLLASSERADEFSSRTAHRLTFA